MTAELLKFSPFGKSERSETQQDKPAQQYASAAPFQGGSDAYNTSASGTGFTNQQDDDDQMPF
jgi:hypothetical protein